MMPWGVAKACKLGDFQDEFTNLAGLALAPFGIGCCNAIPRAGHPVKFSVLEVRSDSVAAAVGLQRLDQIVKFNDREVGKFRPIEIEHAQHQPRTPYSLRIRRGIDKEFDVTVRVPAVAQK